MIKQKTTTINGEEFLLSTIPATKGIKLLKQLTKLIGPSFTELLKGGKTVGKVQTQWVWQWRNCLTTLTLLTLKP
jgi:hypothetical protein